MADTEFRPAHEVLVERLEEVCRAERCAFCDSQMAASLEVIMPKDAADAAEAFAAEVGREAAVTTIAGTLEMMVIPVGQIGAVFVRVKALAEDKRHTARVALCLGLLKTHLEQRV